MTPLDLGRAAADLAPKGRFRAKDPALLALARHLLAELWTARELLREAQYHVTTGEPLDRRIDAYLTADAVPRLDNSAPAGPAESTVRAPVDGVGSPSADPGTPPGPSSTTGPARTPVVLFPAEEPPEVAIRRAREP